jgi:hypothetical protein
MPTIETPWRVAELVAVRTARRHGKSWREIATKLGVTRQSAWERWRDLDDASDATSTETTVERDGVVELVAAEASERLARKWRRHPRPAEPECDRAT